MITLLFRMGAFGIILKLIVVLGLVGMYVYAKLSPHKDRLDPKHRGWYDKFDSIFGGLSRSLGKSMKPYKVGEGIFLDMGQFLLFCILAFLALIMMVGL
jgi:hypothetical protein